MKYILYLITLFSILSCAQFVPPTGGPTDQTAPKLLSSNPITKTKNFKGKVVELNFDEYTDISALKQELIIIPDPNSLYSIKQKDKNIKLIFEKPFADSTTYTFNFRNGIKDLSERNPTKNLKIVFSTGPEIDSLSVKGTIIDLHTKLPVLDALVGLYKKDTLAMNKKKPDYFIKTDSAGQYTFENIKAAKYFLLAFTDKNQNLIYDQKTENVAFKPDTINLLSNIALDTLETYTANYAKNRIKKNISRQDEFVMQLDKPIKEAKVNLTDDALVYNYDKLNLNVFKLSDPKLDTSLAEIILTDSLNISDTIIQKIYFSAPLKNKRKIQSFQINSSIKNGQEQIRNLKFNLLFQYPITKFDSNKVIFKTDTSQIEIPNFKWISKNNIEVSLTTKAKQQVELTIPSNTLQNYKGDTNALFILKTPILGPDDLGTMEGNTIDDKGTKIAQLINEDRGLVTDEQKFKDKFYFKNIIPGSYLVKIIFDNNNNGIWDPGNLSTKSLPEKVLISKESIRVRANFELKDIKIE
jgi:hypothetical protein